jgi:peptidyl-prolyl cis-trans isomerase C
MKQLLIAAVAAATLGLCLPAAAQNVAIVNGKAVPKARLEVLKSQLQRSGRPVNAEMDNMLKEEVVAREVFMQEAQRRGLDASEDYKAQLELARQTILIRELFADYQKKNPVTDAEVKGEYDKFAAANGGREYHARHILVENEADAKKIIADIKKGQKFEELAKKQSKDPGSAANGGDLEWSTPNSYVPEFSQAILKLSKGQMTQEPVKTSFGWHVIRVEDIREAQLPKFDDVKPQIAQQLQQQKLAKFQEELRAKAKVE